MLKQVILVRHDLRLPKGKMSSQVSHGSVEATLRSFKETVSRWRLNGAKKSILRVDSEKELFRYKELADGNGLITALVLDAGKTVVEPGTITCLAIGPAEEEEIDGITGKLKLI
ncbi:MAG: peptidyl-tRNA hydrolase Pth2 [archaeon]